MENTVITFNKKLLLFEIALFFVIVALLVVPYPILRVIFEVILFAITALYVIVCKVKINSEYIRWGVSFFIVCFLSCLWSIDRTASLYGTRGFTEVFLIGFSIYVYISMGGNINKIFNYLIAASFVLAITVIFSYLTGQAISNREASDALFNANILALRASVVSTIALYLYKQKKISFLFLVFLIAIQAVLVLMSGSKKGFISLILGIAFVLTVYSNKKDRFKILVLSICLIFISFALIMNVQYFYNLVGYRFEGMLLARQDLTLGDGSTRLRMAMIDRGLSLWEDRKLIGYGVNTFASISGFGVYSHNNYIEILSGLGIVGLVLYYSIHIKVFWEAWKNRISIDNLTKICVFFVFIQVINDFGMVSYGDEFTMLILTLSFNSFFHNIGQLKHTNSSVMKGKS